MLSQSIPVFDELLDTVFRAERRTLAARDATLRLLLLDTIGCIVAGLKHPTVDAMARALAADGGATALPGSTLRLESGAAAFVTGLAACWDEACEGLPEAHGRPGLHAIAAVLPLALAIERPLGDLLWAIDVGYEFGGRAGQVCRIKPGMHVDGSWGLLAAVAAVAAFRHPDRKQVLADSLAAASCQIPFSLYAPVAQGSSARNTYVGHAAALAPLLVASAASGIGGVRGGLDDYLAIALGREAGAAIVAGAAERLVPRGYLKPFAAVRHVHYAAYAALALREAVRGRVDAIAAITLETYSEAIRYCGNRAPRTAIQAQFSLSYGAAWALLRGDLDPAAYRPEALADAQVRRTESMITLQAADRPDEKRYARLRVVFADGTAEHAEAIDIPGDPLNPMPPDAVHAKFVRFAGETLGKAQADAFARRLLDADPAAPCRAVLAPLLQG